MIKLVEEMIEPYEDLVKEYLEQKNYFVRQSFKYGNNKELDILAINTVSKPIEVVVAEVRGSYCRNTDMLKLKDKLLSKELEEAVVNATGMRPNKRKIFYWLNLDRDEQERAKKMVDLLKPEVQVEPLQWIAQRLFRNAQQENSGVFYSQRWPITTLFQLLSLKES